jgi:hypothetical protein
VEVKLNAIHQLMVYADDVNLLGDNTVICTPTARQRVGKQVLAKTDFW